MWLAGMPGDSSTVSWPSFLRACSWDWSTHLSESGEWDPPKDMYEGFIPGCLLATAGWLPGRTGLGDEWDPEPKTRGHVRQGFLRRVLEPGRTGSWARVSREGLRSPRPGGMRGGSRGRQGGVSREVSPEPGKRGHAV